MTRTLLVSVLALGTLTAGTALASEDHSCNAPMNEWQPREALQTKLEGEGWKVKRIKTEDGCYEAVFDPKTFQMVKMEDDD